MTTSVTSETRKLTTRNTGSVEPLIYRVLRDTGFENTIAAKLAVGDIVEVNAN